MSTPKPTSEPRVTQGAFVGGLVLALIAGFALAKLVSPVRPTAGAPIDAPTPSAMPVGVGHDHAAPGAAGGVGGLSISSAGYTLVPGPFLSGRLSFVVNGPGGQPMTDFADVNEEQLHMIVTRRDLSGYQHLHPAMAPDGTWSVQADLNRPGVWRVFADFTLRTATGALLELTLGYDITVPGEYTPKAIPEATHISRMDGYDVAYRGTPTVGENKPLLFRVTGNATLQPYLGTFGHLVMLREGDLAFLHIHPQPQLADDGAAVFWLSVPSPGTYRMFFDHQVADKVRTAEFTLTVG